MDHVQQEHINETAPEDIRLPTKLGAPRDVTPHGIINAVRYLNTSPPNNPDGPSNISSSSWKMCRVGRWELSYESITADAALRKWFKKPAEFRAEIKGSEPLHAPSDFHIEEDDGEAADGEEDDSIPAELSTLVVAEVDRVDLPTGYKSMGDGIVYNEGRDEKAEVKRSKREESEIEKNEVEESEIYTNEADQSEVEESDHFEDCR